MVLHDVLLIQSKLATWHNALHTLAKGFLPGELISIEDLKSSLITAAVSLRTTHPQFCIVPDPSNISDYYKERVVSLFVSKEDNKYEIFINIKVPLYSVMTRTQWIVAIIVAVISIVDQVLFALAKLNSEQGLVLFHSANSNIGH